MANTRHLNIARIATIVFILGLVLSGLTAIPVEAQLDFATKYISRDGAIGSWLWRVDDAIHKAGRDAPFLFYGYDWLAFGHIAIALAFVPAVRDPVRHRWLFDYGLLLCGLVIVWAMCFGPYRGIPIGWRLIDCSFGVIGSVPLLAARQAARKLAV